MLRLLAFVPCQKAILDQEQLPSAISFINGVKIVWNSDVPIPDDAAVPMTWGVVSSWRRDTGDENKEYEQLIKLIMPDASERMATIVGFHMKTATHHTVLSIGNFPISSLGVALLKTWWREKGSDEWTFASEYPLDVEITFTSLPNAVSA